MLWDVNIANALVNCLPRKLQCNNRFLEIAQERRLYEDECSRVYHWKYFSQHRHSEKKISLRMLVGNHRQVLLLIVNELD